MPRLIGQGSLVRHRMSGRVQVEGNPSVLIGELKSNHHSD
jgi:hypothetical protein